MSSSSIPASPRLQEAVSSNGDAEATPTWLRHHKNNVVNKSSKARPNKCQYGWGNLPAELINRILSLSSEGLEVDVVINVREDKLPVVQALLQRRYLAKMREVCTGWANAINSHPFWLKYLKMMRPDLHESRFPKLSPFKSAQTQTPIVCIPCKLFNPTPTASAAHRGCAAVTERFGKLSTCENHYNTFCTHCLRYQDREDIRLVSRETDIINSQGYLDTVLQVICKFCRDMFFTLAIQQHLTDCARGSRLVYGIRAPWAETAAYSEHIFFGVGSARVMAERAVEDMFLLQNTRWAELHEDAYKLQVYITKLKTHLFKHRHFVPSTLNLNHFEAMVSNLWDDDFSEQGDGPELRTLLRQWLHQMATGQYSEDDYHLDNLRVQFNVRTLLPVIRNRLIDRCITSWANARFYFGFWVMPGDEVQQLLNPADNIHTPFKKIAQSARCPGRTGAQPPEVLHRYVGRFRNPGVVDKGIFLPPQSLLDYFNEQFTTTLNRRLDVPLGEIVDLYRTAKGAVEAEEFCEMLGLPHLTHHMRFRRAWTDGQLARCQALVRTIQGPTTGSNSRDQTQELMGNSPSDAGGETIVSDDEPQSPRVELVDNDTPLQDQFSVKEGWDSYDEDNEEEEERCENDESDEPQEASPSSPALGKRKQSEEEDETNRAAERPARPRLGSGQTTNSSSGDTVNTALVTPDDSPDLMAGTIQLAAEEEPTMDVNTVAGPTSPSSSLGKRKLEEGDDSERPTRRHESRSPSSDDGSESAVPSQHLKVVAKALNEDKPLAESPGASPHTSTVNESTTSTAPDRSLGQTTSNASLTDSATVSSRSSSTVAKPQDMPVLDPDAYYSEYDSDSESDVDDFEYSIPFVPAPSVQLGPGTTEVIRQMWWTARAPLRECHCTICVRAKNDDVTRLLLNNWEQQPILRIV